MIYLRKAPPELFAQALEANLQAFGRSRKLYGHFAEAVLVRLPADGAWVLGADGETWAVRGGASLYDRAGTAAFQRGERLAPARTAVLARVLLHGRQVAVVGAARRAGELGPAARRLLDHLCGVLARDLARREEQR